MNQSFYTSQTRLSSAGFHLPDLALPLQASRTPRNAQASHQQGKIIIPNDHIIIVHCVHLNGYQSPICILTLLSTMQHIPELICVFFPRKRCLWMSESTEFRRTSGLTPRGQRGKSRSSSGDESHYTGCFFQLVPPRKVLSMELVPLFAL